MSFSSASCQEHLPQLQPSLWLSCTVDKTLLLVRSPKELDLTPFKLVHIWCMEVMSADDISSISSIGQTVSWYVPPNIYINVRVIFQV